MNKVTHLARRMTAKAAWVAASVSFRHGLFPLPRAALSFTHDPIAVVVCLWNRPQRITPILSMIDRQLSARPIHLYLWNNRVADAAHYRRVVDTFTSHGVLRSISLVNSPYNVGGLARFYVARKLWKHGYRGGFIMLDDDQDITEHCVSDLVAADAPESISGFWAWTMYGDYWSRRPAQPGDRVSYVGTGGSICDIAIVSDARFFTQLPRYFAFLEDLWMCGYARKRGWALHKCPIEIEFVLDETNQHHSLGAKKGEFYRYLELDDLDPSDSGTTV